MANVPNFYVDNVMYLASGPEYKVLLFAVYKIIGDKIPFEGIQRANISTSDFSTGMNLSRPTVTKALASLVRYRLIVPIGKPTHDGQIWELTTPDVIDFAGLKTRKELEVSATKKRMQKVRPAPADNPAPGLGSDRVYLVEMGDTGHYKIGHSRNPRARIREFNTPLPIKFICAIECENAVQLEAELHVRFSARRMRAEWFALSDEDVGYIKSLVGGRNHG
jgi:hypothetical protein